MALPPIGSPGTPVPVMFALPVIAKPLLVAPMRFAFLDGHGTSGPKGGAWSPVAASATLQDQHVSSDWLRVSSAEQHRF